MTRTELGNVDSQNLSYIAKWRTIEAVYFSGFREVPIIEFHTPFKTVNLESWKVLAFNLILQCQKRSIIKGR